MGQLDHPSERSSTVLAKGNAEIMCLLEMRSSTWDLKKLISTSAAKGDSFT